uniref:Cytochrome b6-f complex subunit 6 n=1 Tax=Cyathodium smaragdinum TaxID=2846787 RepID=A0A8F2XVL5_9MARC|nr:cytochrome b6/f complex subunit VI [Cyathodium smaragdinum]
MLTLISYFILLFGASIVALVLSIGLNKIQLI